MNGGDLWGRWGTWVLEISCFIIIIIIIIIIIFVLFWAVTLKFRVNYTTYSRGIAEQQ